MEPTQYQQIGAGTDVGFSFRSPAEETTQTQTAKRMHSVATNAGIAAPETTPPASLYASLDYLSTEDGGYSSLAALEESLNEMKESAIEASTILDRHPIQQIRADPHSPTKIASYNTHELVEINRELKLSLTDSQITQIANLLREAPGEMEKIDDAPRSINIEAKDDGTKTSRAVSLTIRGEAIHLEVKALGSGAYKSTQAVVKVASENLKAPHIAKLQAQGILKNFFPTEEQKEELSNEIRINKKLYSLTKTGDESCSNITSIKSFTYASTGETVFKSALADGDVSRGNANFSNLQRLQTAMGCCKGLAQLHAQGIIHRDVKMDNFLYWKDEKGNITAKVADMGKAVDLNDPESIGWDCSEWVVKYISPEMVMDSERVKTDPSRDDFAAGLMLLEMYSGKTIPNGNSWDQTVKNQYNFIQDMSNYDNLPDDVYEVVVGLLSNSSCGYYEKSPEGKFEYREGTKNTNQKLTTEEAYKKLEAALAKMPTEEISSTTPFSQPREPSRYSPLDQKPPAGYASLS